MSDTKHTPMPWKIVWERDTDHDGPRRAESIGPIAAKHDHWSGWTIADEVDAEFVFQACSCHANLLAACEKSQRCLRSLVGLLDWAKDHGASREALKGWERFVADCGKDNRAALAKAQPQPKGAAP